MVSWIPDNTECPIDGKPIRGDRGYFVIGPDNQGTRPRYDKCCSWECLAAWLVRDAHRQGVNHERIEFAYLPKKDRLVRARRSSGDWRQT